MQFHNMGLSHSYSSLLLSLLPIPPVFSPSLTIFPSPFSAVA